MATKNELTATGAEASQQERNGTMEAPVAATPSPATKNGDGERVRAVDAAILQIEKQFGRGAIMRLGDREAQNIPAVSTGSVALDLALGVGGVPRGRITEIFGPESSGKTTLCYHVAANAQAKGGIVAFIDAEHALDPGYAKNVGVNVDELLVSQPDTGEQALEIAETLIRSGGVDVVIVDSVAALVPRAEIEGDMGDSFVGLQARLMSQALRKLTGAINRSQTALIFTNQLREKIGVMFGNPETTPGGRALKFYASVRLDIRRIETLKTGTDAIGSRTRVKVVKNKVASPFRVAEFDIMYNEGISREGGLLDVGIAAGILSKTGAWFNYGDMRLGQGRENARDFLKQNPEVAERIDDEIRGKVASIEVGPEGISEAE
jgi:recombination protein RecA